MKTMCPSYAHEHSVNIPGVKLPKGCVYMRMNRTEHFPLTYVWVTNLKQARDCTNGFTAHIITEKDDRPRERYIDAHRGYGKVLKKYIEGLDRALTERTECEPIMDSKTLRRHLDVPRDREVGRYIMRAYPGAATNPNTITDYSTKGDFAGIIPVITKSTRRTVPNKPEMPEPKKRSVTSATKTCPEYKMAVNSARAAYLNVCRNVEWRSNSYTHTEQVKANAKLRMEKEIAEAREKYLNK